MTVSQKELKELLEYNQVTGCFTWKVSGSGRRKDKTAGCLNRRGYVRIKINRKNYRAHRLAWMYMEGYFPENGIDHIDRVKSNNSIANLREVSQSCNIRNGGQRRNNTSGIKGVSFHHGKWQAKITVDNKQIHLGRFTSKLDAAKARHVAEIEHNFPSCNTDFAAMKYITEHEQGENI